jgi:hypothetical protein
MAHIVVWETDPAYFVSNHAPEVGILNITEDGRRLQKTDSGYHVRIPSADGTGKDSGKWYWEITRNSNINNSIGLRLSNYRNNGAGSLPGMLTWSIATGAAVVALDNTNTDETVPATVGVSTLNGGTAIGNTLGIAIDLSTYKIWVRTDAGWNGDPEAGTGEVFSGISELHKWYPFSYSLIGQDVDISINGGDTPFVHTLPDGYKGLSATGTTGTTYFIELVEASKGTDSYERVADYNVAVTAATKGSDGNETPGFTFGDVITETGSVTVITSSSPSYGTVTATSSSTIVAFGSNLTTTLVIDSETGATFEAWVFTGKIVALSGSGIDIDGEVVTALYPYDGYCTVGSTLVVLETLTLTVEGNLTVTLPVMTMEAYGGATGEMIFPSLECAATGITAITGNWNEALPFLTCSGIGTVSINGELQENLFLVECLATGVLGITGNLAADLPLLEITAAGHAEGSGTAEITFPVLACYGTGNVDGRFDSTILRHSRY